MKKHVESIPTCRPTPSTSESGLLSSGQAQQEIARVAFFNLMALCIVVEEAISPYLYRPTFDAYMDA